MGRVTTPIKLVNYIDMVLQNLGHRTEAPREMTVEALVDTGATELCLRKAVIEQLGLQAVSETPLRTANGTRTVRVFAPVLLDVLGRSRRFDVIELSDDSPDLLGQVPLEVLDFVVDPKRQRLIGNPEHGGQWMAEAY